MAAQWVGEWPLSPPRGGASVWFRAGDWQEQATVSGTRRCVARAAGGASPEGQRICLPKGEDGDRAEEKVVGMKGRAGKPQGGKGGELLQGAAPCFWGSGFCVSQELAAHRRAQPRQVYPLKF